MAGDGQALSSDSRQVPLALAGGHGTLVPSMARRLGSRFPRVRERGRGLDRLVESDRGLSFVTFGVALAHDSLPRQLMRTRGHWVSASC